MILSLSLAFMKNLPAPFVCKSHEFQKSEKSLKVLHNYLYDVTLPRNRLLTEEKIRKTWLEMISVCVHTCALAGLVVVLCHESNALFGCTLGREGEIVRKPCILYETAPSAVTRVVVLKPKVRGTEIKRVLQIKADFLRL